MVLPVPWCWANVSLNHLSSLPLCHLCSNRLPARPVNPQCIHQRRVRCPVRDSPDASEEAETDRGLWSSQQRWQEWGRGSCLVELRRHQGSFSYLPPVAAVPVQVSPCWVRFQWLSSGSICFVLAVPLVLEWQGLAPCFTSDSAPLLVLQSHCHGLFEELWMVLAFETNRFWL